MIFEQILRVPAWGHRRDGVREQVDGLEVVLLRVVEVLVLRGAVLQGLEPRAAREHSDAVRLSG